MSLRTATPGPKPAGDSAADRLPPEAAEALAYTVRCTFHDEAVRDEWVAWVAGGHAQDVVAAGAASAEVVVLSEPAGCAEARYRFATRADFDAYVADHAPRLRAEGLTRFPLARGLRYERSIGVVREV